MKIIIQRNLYRVLIILLFQTPGLFAIQERTLTISVGVTDLIEIPENLKYLATSLAKNLCAGITQTDGYELAGCGLNAKTESTDYIIGNIIRSENQQLTFEAMIRDKKGQVLATIKSESGSEQYHGLILESHTKTILARLAELQIRNTTPAAISSIKTLLSPVHRHDGFYFNAVAGTGWANIDRMAMGGAGLFGIKLGGAVSDHVVLFGAIDTYWMFSPIMKTVITLGDKSIALSGNLDGYILMPNFSAGAGYYTDSNYFLLLSMGMAAWQIKSDVPQTTFGGTKESNPGSSLSLSIGKEWWISDNWGIGVALIGHGAINMSRGVYGSGYYFAGIAVTATYN